VQTVDSCTYSFTHMPKHMQSAYINKKFKSDVNKESSVQRSELNVLRKKNLIWELSQSDYLAIISKDFNFSVLNFL